MKHHLLRPIALITLATIAHADQGLLRITTDPVDAQIFINGQKKGNSPSEEGNSFAVKLPEGEYVVEAHKSTDNKDYYGMKSVFVANDTLQTVRLSLYTLPLKPYGSAANGSTVVNGLEWLRCSVGQQWTGKFCEGVAKKYTFEEAKAIPNTFNATGYGGKRDWRVPTIRELQILRVCRNGFSSDSIDFQDGGGEIKQGCEEELQRGNIDEARFPNTPGLAFWSSSPDSRYRNSAWGISFRNGGLIAPIGTRGALHVRLVR